MKKFLFLFFFIPAWLVAQQNLPLNREWTTVYPSEIDSNISLSCFKPYIVSPVHPPKNKTLGLLHRKLKKESLFIVHDTADKFYLTLDPLFNFEGGKDLNDSTKEKLYKNTRGFLLKANIGEKFSMESSFYENQSTFVSYIDQYIQGTDDLFASAANYDYNVIPGQGRSKKFKLNGYDYAMASGYISYTPVKIINIQAGHGKHFIGDGYRSLLLSDNAFNYPFARITATYKNIQYTNLYTSFMNLTNGGNKIPPGIERLFQKKTGSFQFLSVHLWKRLTLGAFQGMIWEAADSINKQHVNFHTFNPVIGINALNYGLRDKNNILLGLTCKLKIIPDLFLYGQFMLDDAKRNDDNTDVRNKHGYQAGFKYINAFTINNLMLQAEYNTVRPYAYASQHPQQSYSHYNQALTHPLGANFREVVGILNYRLRDFFTEIKCNYALKGKDSLLGNFGGNVFKADTQQIPSVTGKMNTTQGLLTTILYQDVHIGYLINPVTNLNIVIGLTNRMENVAGKTAHTQFVYMGICTSLSNFYYDF